MCPNRVICTELEFTPDHVVEIGGAGTLNQSITACRVGGHIAMIGVLTGREGEVSTVRLLANQIRLQGVMVGSRADQLAMVRAFEACRIKPIVDASFALEDMGQAFRHQMSGSHFGKIKSASARIPTRILVEIEAN